MLPFPVLQSLGTVASLLVGAISAYVALSAYRNQREKERYQTAKEAATGWAAGYESLTAQQVVERDYLVHALDRTRHELDEAEKQLQILRTQLEASVREQIRLQERCANLEAKITYLEELLLALPPAEPPVPDVSS